MKIHSFQPVVGKDPRILILGSMPGAESLKQGQYYAHPRNSFWRIMYDLMDVSFSDSYDDRIELLKKHGIALWDVLQHCERKGSLDKDIKNEYPNNFDLFLGRYSGIKAVFFNGQKAANSYKSQVDMTAELAYHTLTSTSPANTHRSYLQKLEEWRVVQANL